MNDNVFYDLDETTFRRKMLENAEKQTKAINLIKRICVAAMFIFISNKTIESIQKNIAMNDPAYYGRSILNPFK